MRCLRPHRRGATRRVGRRQQIDANHHFGYGLAMRVADLFSGCGGMSSGFTAAGYDVVFAAEKWPRARLVYDQNFGHAASQIDLSNVVEAVSAVARWEPEIIVGGPPCQDFSAAGLRQETSRADLTWSFAEVVRACRPAWFVMENVPEAGESRAWRTARGRLASAGYGITETVLDASLFGVPQLRKRRFLIGRQGEDDDFLAPYLADRETETALTVRGYLGDELGVEHYYRHPRHWGRRAIYSIDEPSATVRSTNRPIGPGYSSHPLDSAPIDGVKPLNSKQRARIQTFDSGFVFDDRLHAWEIDLMVANAVPVKLVENVARAISAYSDAKAGRPQEKEFRRWLQEKHGYTERAAGNVASRLKRARRMLPAAAFVDVRDEIHALQKSEEFSPLSVSVRSQLKRALQLHSEFSGFGQ